MLKPFWMALTDEDFPDADDMGEPLRFPTKLKAMSHARKIARMLPGVPIVVMKAVCYVELPVADDIKIGNYE